MNKSGIRIKSRVFGNDKRMRTTNIKLLTTLQYKYIS